MQRNSDKHGPRLDDELKRETQSIDRSGREARAQEFREQEGPGDYEPAAVGHVDGDESLARRELLRHLTPSAFPGDREAMIAAAEADGAPLEVLDRLRELPPGRDFVTGYEVWGALGGETDDVPSEVAHRSGHPQDEDA